MFGIKDVAVQRLLGNHQATMADFGTRPARVEEEEERLMTKSFQPTQFNDPQNSKHTKQCAGTRNNIVYVGTELSTGRMDPRGRVGSGWVTILPDFGGSGRVSTSDFSDFY